MRRVVQLRAAAGSLAVVAAVALLVAAPAAQNRAAARKVPTFRVDPAWPKPLPNRWILGAAFQIDRVSFGCSVEGRCVIHT